MKLKKLPFSTILFVILFQFAYHPNKAFGLDASNERNNYLLYDEYVLYISSDIFRNVFRDYNLQIEWRTLEYHTFALSVGYYPPRIYEYSSLLNSQKFKTTTANPGLCFSAHFRQYFDYEFEGKYIAYSVLYSFLPQLPHAEFAIAGGWMYMPYDFLAIRAEVGPKLRYFYDLNTSNSIKDELQFNIHYAISVGFVF